MINLTQNKLYQTTSRKEGSIFCSAEIELEIKELKVHNFRKSDKSSYAGYTGKTKSSVLETSYGLHTSRHKNVSTSL